MSSETIALIVEFLSGLFVPRRHPVRRLALLAVAGVLGLLGLIFLTIAAYLALAVPFSPPIAAAIVGGGLAILAGGTAWAALRTGTGAARRSSADVPIAMLLELAGGFAGELESAVQAAPGSAAAAAFAAGCIVGSQGDLTRGLQSSLRNLIR